MLLGLLQILATSAVFLLSQVGRQKEAEPSQGLGQPRWLGPSLCHPPATTWAFSEKSVPLCTRVKDPALHRFPPNRREIKNLCRTGEIYFSNKGDAGPPLTCFVYWLVNSFGSEKAPLRPRQSPSTGLEPGLAEHNKHKIRTRRNGKTVI